jgi:glutathione S-transferase
MSFTLHDYVLSGNCYKVRLFAQLLGVSYTVKPVDFHPGKAHKTLGFLALNPHGTLPVLESNDIVLTDSSAMLVWIAQQFDTNHTWWPINDAHSLALTVQWLGFSAKLTESIGHLRLHTMLNRPADAVTLHALSTTNLQELENHLCEQSIRRQAYLTGKYPTIADIACFAYAALSPDAGIEHTLYPGIRGWLHRIRCLEGFLTMPGIYEAHETRNEHTAAS